MGARGAIAFEGQRYRLVDASIPMPRDPRDGYRLVGAALAANLVKRMADRIPTTAEERARWAEAASMALEPPEGRGLSLLRYDTLGSGTKADSPDEPAVTPSQLRPKIADEHWIEIEVVYDDGARFEGSCVVELPGGRTTEGPPGEGGRVRVDRLTAGDCKLSFPALDAGAFKSA
jgi:hypothetical protein